MREGLPGSAQPRVPVFLPRGRGVGGTLSPQQHRDGDISTAAFCKNLPELLVILIGESPLKGERKEGEKKRGREGGREERKRKRKNTGIAT